MVGHDPRTDDGTCKLKVFENIILLGNTASKSPVPEQVQNGIRIKRRDLTSYYDEADYAIPQHVHSLFTEEGRKCIKVLSADTDVFVLLCHYFSQHWKDKNPLHGFFFEWK